MQENTTNRNWLALRKRASLMACTLFAGASFLACGEDASVAANSGSEPDSAAAYAALSATLEACDDRLDACTQQASADPKALAACDTEAMSCKQKAQSAEQHAQSSLQQEAASCRKHCQDDDAGAGDMHGCIDKHAPKLPGCVKDLVVCLEAAGVRKADATPTEIGACLHAAHDCFKDELQKQREARRARRDGHKAAAGSGSPSTPTAGSNSAGAGAGGSAAHVPARAVLLPPFWRR